jgi:hypothetical protein
MAAWKDPVKDRPASESTLNISGDFDRFTGVMRRLMQVRPEDVRDASSPSAPDSDASYTGRSASEPSGQSLP